MKFLQYGFLFALAMLFLGCGAQKYNVSPNDPRYEPCFDSKSKTAKNCNTITPLDVLHSKSKWRVSAYKYGHKVVELPNDGLFVSFGNGKVAGSFGCNQFFGDYILERDDFSINNAGMTRRMCDETTMQLEDMLGKHFLNATTKILVVGDEKKVDKIFFLGKDFYLVLD